MERDIKIGKYVEHGEYDGQLFGTKYDSVRHVIRKGKMSILDLNAQVCWPVCCTQNIPIKKLFLAPAVTVGETEGAMDSTSVFFCLFFYL